MGNTVQGYAVILNEGKRYGWNETEHECHLDTSRIDTYQERRKRNCGNAEERGGECGTENEEMTAESRQL